MGGWINQLKSTDEFKVIDFFAKLTLANYELMSFQEAVVRKYSDVLLN